MLKQFISLAAAASLVSISTPSAFAGSGQEAFDPFAHYGLPSEVSGSFYIKVPFTGGLKKSAIQEPRFGFALKAKLGSGYSNYSHPLSAPIGTNITNGMVNIVDLSFGFSGKDSFRFNGLNFTDVKAALNADEDGKNNSWVWIVGGVVLVGGLAAALALSGDGCNEGDLGCIF